mmetsp:Transcript_33168/g.86719  ORF Transcript_33168/g.86719 Transcript_33168/m.86719 type:complete len:221 (-) Transcript_33168:45-707(-)|eukprot:CAMPEP_0182948072 /NCGR_PEP_ID=MMETSP0105_2-20130417/59573_1 /TAXON_ID=81532 ORGANISM="Acanthoeca-like sp., Strain 10tr" /NCGR_SAMPLE_ID=MMETSP0105_2 /ASSEMBLY_ACC=CAM_ASM_000205 /LENGTH=220 /DNA_ID=CAMNT_0025088359 /DNA_START=642 /DNA_END=1304 /DNA_ORIENTATION=-
MAYHASLSPRFGCSYADGDGYDDRVSAYGVTTDDDAGCQTAMIGGGPDPDGYGVFPSAPSPKGRETRRSWEGASGSMGLGGMAPPARGRPKAVDGMHAVGVAGTPVSGELCSLFSATRIEAKGHDSSPDTPCSVTPMPQMQPDFLDLVSLEAQTPMVGFAPSSTLGPRAGGGGAGGGFGRAASGGSVYLSVDLSQNQLYQRRMNRRANRLPSSFATGQSS